MSHPLDPLRDALGADARLHAVGGAMRDRLLGRGGGDWDLATALGPEEVLDRARQAGLRAIPTGLRHGTVTVLVQDHPVEITTFRGEGEYRDGRRPESVRLGVTLEEDLSRRDFTINAMALPLERLDAPDWRDHLVDPFGGLSDLAARRIRCVGDPLTRFGEDGLRPLRACRFAAQLGFAIDGDTLAAIPGRLDVCARVAVERVFVELTKLLCAPEATLGLRALEACGLLDLWLPELRPTLGCTQNALHAFDVWEHTLAAVGHAPAEPSQRWAALLHDLGKPATRTRDAQDRVHFYGHEQRSGELAAGVLARLRAAHDLRDTVLALVRHHNTHPAPEWSDAACRRFLRRLAQDHLPLEAWDAFVRADLAAKGLDVEARLQAQAGTRQRLERLQAAAPPLHVRQLALDGAALAALGARPPGPWVGSLQHHLLDLVLEDPSRNTPLELADRARAWLQGPNAQEEAGQPRKMR